MIDIDALTEAELIALNRRVVLRLRVVKAGQVQQALHSFMFGDYVAFTQTNGEVVKAMVVRPLKTNVALIDDHGVHWAVPPLLLRKIPKPPGYVPKPVADFNRIMADFAGDSAGKKQPGKKLPGKKSIPKK